MEKYCSDLNAALLLKQYFDTIKEVHEPERKLEEVNEKVNNQSWLIKQYERILDRIEELVGRQEDDTEADTA